MATVTRRMLVMCGLVVTCFSCVFQLLGFTCPGWLVVTIDLEVVGVMSGGAVVGFGEIVSKSAVWYYHVCVQGDGALAATCNTGVEHDTWKMGFRLGHIFSRIQDVDWIEVEIELSLALVFCLVALMIVASTYSGLVELGLKTSTLLASGSIIISGVLILPPVIKVSRDICYVSEDVTSIVDVTGRQLVAVDFPWALMLSAVGLLLAFIAGAIFLIAAFRRDADFMTISPQSFLAPAILSLGTFPAHISVQDRLGHIPPSELKPRSDSFLIPPPIGSHDDAPFSFQNGRLRRETAFDFPPPSFAFFISGENSPTGSSTGMQSRPPSSGRLSCSSDVITATNIPVITVDQTCESTPLTAAESKTKAPDIAKPDTERNTNCDAGNVKNTQKSVTTLSSIFEAKDNNKHTETSVKQDFKSSAKSSFVAATAEPNLRKKTTKQTAVHPIELVTKENKLLDKENTKIVTDKGSTDIKENPIKRSTNISTRTTAKRVKTSPAPKIIVQRYKLRTKSNDGQAPVKQDIKLRKVVKRFKPEMTLENAINKDNTERESKVVRVPVVTFTNCGCLQGESNVQDISKM